MFRMQVAEGCVAEGEDGLNGTIVPFVTSDDSRRDHEICWLLDHLLGGRSPQIRASVSDMKKKKKNC